MQCMLACMFARYVDCVGYVCMCVCMLVVQCMLCVYDLDVTYVMYVMYARYLFYVCKSCIFVFMYDFVFACM